MTFIFATNLKKSYESGRGRVAVLRGLNLQVQEGEFVAVVGPSGCGKSTLLHLIGGLDRPDSGALKVGGRELPKLTDRQLALFRRGEVGVIFQFFNLFSSLTVLENVLLPAWIGGGDQAKKRKRASLLLERVGLKELEGQRANELSGGEMQRVALCRALLNRPKLLLADEPTGNLDSANREIVYRILRDLHRDEGTTLLLVTHELEIAGKVDRVIPMRDGVTSS